MTQQSWRRCRISAPPPFRRRGPGCRLPLQEQHLHALQTPPPPSVHQGPGPLNATSVAKCKQLMCLSASPFRSRKFRNRCNSNKRFVIVQMQKGKKLLWYSQCPKSMRKGEGGKRERECICVSTNSVHRSKTSVDPYCAHMPPISCLQEWLYLPEN